ncbi:hypothetical protein WJX82_005290 [Trebouxia sp. C0006]
MTSNGWQFSVTIPSWTQATLEGDENIVFYRVEVKVLPPEVDAAPRTRSVLRRFSHFTKLHARLKEELGNKKMAKLEPPSKNRLVGVNKRPDLVEKRRRELESWLWKLIGDGEIARSRVLNNFLELSDAARLVQRVAPSPLPSRPASQTGSYAWSEGGSSSMHEGSSQQSGAAPSNVDFSLHSPGLDGPPPVRPGLPPLQRSASDGTQQIPNPQGPPSDTHQQPMARSASTSEPRMRLGLRVEQRVTVKHHVKALQQQLDRAAGDLQDAMEAIYTERHTKRQLAGQLADLQARASESGVAQAAAREADLASSLEQARDLSAQLQQDLTNAQASMTDLQQEVVQAQEAAAAAAAEAQQSEQEHMRSASVSESEAEDSDQPTVAPPVDAPSAIQGEIESRDATASSQSLQDLQAQKAAAEEKAAAMHAEMVAFTKQVADAEAKSRADRKVLAREVKALRKQLEVEKQPAAAKEAEHAARESEREVAALRQRLHDSSIEVVAGQTAAGQELKPQEAMDMLSTCDGRLQALMAEANLLGETASSQTQTSAEDLELRQVFASILIESGALRQQINALLRDKYEAEAHSRNAQTQQTAPDVKGLFRKFTPGMPFLGPQSNGASNHAEEDAAKPAFGQGIGDRFAGFGDRFSKSFNRPQQ